MAVPIEQRGYVRPELLAETAWLPPEQKDLADFKRRLRTHLRRLDTLGVAYRRPEDLG